MYQANIYIAAALQLIQQNGKTTSLEVKNFIREKFPNFYCVQQEVSENLIDAEKNGYIDLIEDNGTYRTYGKNLFTKLSLDELCDKLETFEKKQVTLDFRKKGEIKKGIVGTINASDNTHFYYFNSTNEEKRFKRKNLLAFIVNNKTFTL